MPRREITLQDEIDSMEASRRQLDKEIAQKRTEQLRSLHESAVLANTDALVRALWSLASAGLRKELGSESAPASPVGDKAKGRRYDEKFKQRVRFAMETRELTLAQVQREFGPAPVTVMKWRKQWAVKSPNASNGVSPSEQPSVQASYFPDSPDPGMTIMQPLAAAR